MPAPERIPVHSEEDVLTETAGTVEPDHQEPLQHDRQTQPAAVDRLIAFMNRDPSTAELNLSQPVDCVIAISRFVRHDLTRIAMARAATAMEMGRQPVMPRMLPQRAVEQQVRTALALRDSKHDYADAQTKAAELSESYGQAYPQIAAARTLAEQLRQRGNPLLLGARSLLTIYGMCAAEQERRHRTGR